MPAEADDLDALAAAHITAQRDALAMAIHAARGDSEFVARTFNGSEQPELTIHMLARLPYLLVTGYAAEHDEAIDFEGRCEEMLRGLPKTVQEVNELADGDRPFADEDDQED
jgi:hypothetical protein